jgi:hypothetical protein
LERVVFGKKTTQLDWLAARLNEAMNWPETVILRHYSRFCDMNVDRIALENGF